MRTAAALLLLVCAAHLAAAYPIFFSRVSGPPGVA